MRYAILLKSPSRSCEATIETKNVPYATIAYHYLSNRQLLATLSGLLIWNAYGCPEESITDVLVGGVQKVKVRVYLDKIGRPNEWRYNIEVLAIDPDSGEDDPTKVLYKMQVDDGDETTAIEAKELREKHEHRNPSR